MTLTQVRPRESTRFEEEVGKKLKKAATVRQQQKREEEMRLARRERHREEVRLKDEEREGPLTLTLTRTTTRTPTQARLKDEEREVLRAQIYAINRLMRAREESAFAEFRLKREAEALCGPGGGEAVEHDSADGSEEASASDGLVSAEEDAAPSPSKAHRVARRHSSEVAATALPTAPPSMAAPTKADAAAAAF